MVYIFYGCEALAMMLKNGVCRCVCVHCGVDQRNNVRLFWPTLFLTRWVVSDVTETSPVATVCRPWINKYKDHAIMPVFVQGCKQWIEDLILNLVRFPCDFYQLLMIQGAISRCHTQEVQDIIYSYICCLATRPNPCFHLDRDATKNVCLQSSASVSRTVFCWLLSQLFLDVLIAVCCRRPCMCLLHL